MIIGKCDYSERVWQVIYFWLLRHKRKQAIIATVKDVIEDFQAPECYWCEKTWGLRTEVI